MTKRLLISLTLMLAVSLAGCRTDAGNVTSPSADDKGQTHRSTHTETTKNMKITIKTGREIFHATLYDNAAARDFMAQLPLTLTLEDYNETEKIASLPIPLSTAGSPDGFVPEKGDIAFYAPWGNMCIFYRDFRYSPGLVALGKMEGDSISTLAANDRITVTIDIRK